MLTSCIPGLLIGKLNSVLKSVTFSVYLESILSPYWTTSLNQTSYLLLTRILTLEWQFQLTWGGTFTSTIFAQRCRSLNFVRRNFYRCSPDIKSGVRRADASINYQPMHCWSETFQLPRSHLSEIWASSLMLIWWCEHTFNEQYQDVLLCSVSCDRFELRVDCNVSDIGGCSGDVQTGLWKQRADWSSDPPDTPPPVSAERCSTAGM